jgi:hypothetical protein
MPNRVQTLRSSVPGNVPQAGTRAPGELWLNFVDGHIGYIDSAQTAQKLLGVRLFVTSANYVSGDFVVYAGNLYQAVAPSASGPFIASNWTKIGTAQDLSQYLNLGGGTLTGPLVLAADPSAPAQAATKNYVDVGDAAVAALANTKLPLTGGTLTGALNGTTGNFSGVATAADPPAQDSSSKLVTTAWFGSHQPVIKENSNRIINGDMRLDQRNNGASGTAAGYTIDRWAFSVTQIGKLVWQRGSPAVNPSGCPYYLFWSVASAYTPLATDTFAMSQPIEADMVGDFAFGTAGAQPVTLSFWVSSNQTGTFSGSLRNGANNRSYPFTYSTVQGVFTKNVITIPGDTAGTWVASGNAEAIRVLFDLGCGANVRGPAGAWASANYIGASGTVQLVAIASATLAITGVKLEVGSIATPFNRQTMAKSLIDCQRYYQLVSGLVLGGYSSGAGGGLWTSYTYMTQMRAAPTSVVNNPTYINASGLTVSAYPMSVFANATVVAAGGATVSFGVSLTAEL